ncbi:hypothetical protein [Stenotrophomonas rhizophila]|uniref:hypothetical protein n=1 Tax=Stenotrophomonas rhizophila TaxID=216778 RepID=UPI003395F221
MEKLADFLASTPPGVSTEVEQWFSGTPHSGINAALPRIRLHCSSEHCGGERFFKSKTPFNLPNIVDGIGVWRFFATYVCSDCDSSYKTFALDIRRARSNPDEYHFIALKFGENPAFGPPIPPRAMTLVGADRELFLKGRRAETMGLGVGAFAYYRRVIESQKERIFNEFIRVLKATLPYDPVIADLERAKTETQFSKSLQAIKHALPGSLLINGQNPIALLHTALSEGLHALGDEECLQYAAAIRTVIFETSDRLASAMRDDKEVSNAVALLTKAGQKREAKPLAPTPPDAPGPSESQAPQD